MLCMQSRQMIQEMDSDFSKNIWGMPALIPQPDTERSVEESIETGMRSYGESKGVIR